MIMEKTEERPNIERTNHDDHDLAEELESLYCRVAQLDQPDRAAENRGTPGNSQGLEDLPRQAAPEHAPPNREELMEKLMAIRDAYERLLTYWPFTRECPPRPAFQEASPEISIRNAPPDGN